MKQRRYTNDNSVVVKFLPWEFAVILASIILHIKPVDAAFCSKLYGSSPKDTCSFLFTLKGVAVEPEKMTTILAETFGEYGLDINMADLRHALEAFAHKLGKPNAAWDPFLAQMASHTTGTSSRYGRDQNCMVNIPAEVTEANAESCNVWNSVILRSPCTRSREGRGAGNDGSSAGSLHNCCPAVLQQGVHADLAPSSRAGNTQAEDGSNDASGMSIPAASPQVYGVPGGTSAWSSEDGMEHHEAAVEKDPGSDEIVSSEGTPRGISLPAHALPENPRPNDASGMSIPAASPQVYGVPGGVSAWSSENGMEHHEAAVEKDPGSDEIVNSEGTPRGMSLPAHALAENPHAEHSQLQTQARHVAAGSAIQ